MKKTTIARVITTAASTAGALVCPQLVANQYADVAIKAGTATLRRCLPDTISWGWKKSTQDAINAEVIQHPVKEGEIPAAHVTTTDIRANIKDGVTVEQHTDPVTPTAAPAGKGDKNKTQS